MYLVPVFTLSRVYNIMDHDNIRFLRSLVLLVLGCLRVRISSPPRSLFRPRPKCLIVPVCGQSRTDLANVLLVDVVNLGRKNGDNNKTRAFTFECFGRAVNAYLLCHSRYSTPHPWPLWWTDTRVDVVSNRHADRYFMYHRYNSD